MTLDMQPTRTPWPLWRPFAKPRPPHNIVIRAVPGLVVRLDLAPCTCPECLADKRRWS